MGISGSQAAHPPGAQAIPQRRRRRASNHHSPSYPTHLYFISGEPKLKFTGNPNHGPLFFHLDEAGIYKAESNCVLCYPIVGSVPTKQRMEVKLLGSSEITERFAAETRRTPEQEEEQQSPSPTYSPEEQNETPARRIALSAGPAPSMIAEEKRPGTVPPPPLLPFSPCPAQGRMAQLRFDVAASKFIHRLSVYVGVEVAFVKSRGVILCFNDHAVLKNQHCILDVHRAMGGVYTTNPFPLWALEAHQWSALPPINSRTEASARGRVPDLPTEKQQVVHKAPIAIVLYMMDEHGTDPCKTASVLQRSRELARGQEREGTGGEGLSSGVFRRIPPYPCPSPLRGSGPQPQRKSVGDGGILRSSGLGIAHTSSAVVPKTNSILDGAQEGTKSTNKAFFKESIPDGSANGVGSFVRRGIGNAGARQKVGDSVFSSFVCEHDGKGSEDIFHEGGVEGRPREDPCRTSKSVGSNKVSMEAIPSADSWHTYRSSQHSMAKGLSWDEEMPRRRRGSPQGERYSCIQYTFLDLPPGLESSSSFLGKSTEDSKPTPTGLGSNPLLWGTRSLMGHEGEGDATNVEQDGPKGRSVPRGTGDDLGAGPSNESSTPSGAPPSSSPLDPVRSVERVEVNGVAGKTRGDNEECIPTAGKTFMWERSVIQQLLQIGPEVYVLEDVFDMGHHDTAEKSVFTARKEEGSSRDREGGTDIKSGEEEGDEEIRDSKEGDDEDEEEEAGEEEDYLCVVCLVEPKDTAMLPCRHMCCCQYCARRVCMSSNKCPICRAEVETTLKCSM